MKDKLYFKFIFIFSLITVICLFIGYFYLFGNIKKQLENNLIDNLKDKLFIARDFLTSYLSENKKVDSLDAIADKIGKILSLNITIINQEGKVLAASHRGSIDISNVENNINRAEIQEAIHKGFGVSKVFSATAKQNFIYAAITFRENDFSGFIRLALPLKDIELFEKKLQRIILFSFLFLFGLSFLFVHLAYFIVSKPIKEVFKVVKAMADGDFSKKPLVYSRDEIGNLVMALSDVSRKVKENIEWLKEERAKLDAVLSSMFEGVMVVDENGKILIMNPSLKKLFFIDFEPKGKIPLEVIRNSQIQEIVDKIIEERQNFITEQVIINQPEEKIFKVNASAIMRNDILVGAVLVFHDITELRRLEKIRQDFVANVSHELRTPISNIKGYAETILDGAIDDKKNLQDFINIIYQESNRLANLIEDLLDLSQIEYNKMAFVFMPVDIKPILTRCIMTLERPIKAKGISITLDIQDNLPMVLADERRLLQVFLNLLDNAVKYNKEKGNIKIKAFTNDKMVQVEISDTGIGIPQKDLPRIFERFYRVDKARSRELGGTGLGLSIVKHIILAHKGNIWVESELSKGSTFTFTLPKA